jgi:triphosphoribosyl-dephospho-CoA synthase
LRGRAAARRLDRHLRKDGHRLNPGASADVVTAALFVSLLERRPGAG